MLVTPQAALALAQSTLIRAGATELNAHRQADLLIEGELRGQPSHGLLRLPRLVRRAAFGVLDPKTSGAHKWVRSSFLSVDGRNGFGPVVACEALEQLLPRCRQTGIAMASIRNANHLGMLAYYADIAAKADAILIAITTSEALVHPWGGKTAMLGTNPISIGVPAHPEPFILDMATGLISMGKIHSYAAANRPLEPGWALDADGNPTTDAQAATQGSIAPFGGAKGYGLGIALEILVASITQSAFGRDITGTLDDNKPSTKGDVFIVLDPPTEAASAVTHYLDEVRASATSDPIRPVTIPGDGATARRRHAMANGIEVNESLWLELEGLAKHPPNQMKGMA